MPHLRSCWPGNQPSRPILDDLFLYGATDQAVEPRQSSLLWTVFRERVLHAKFRSRLGKLLGLARCVIKRLRHRGLLLLRQREWFLECYMESPPRAVTTVRSHGSIWQRNSLTARIIGQSCLSIRRHESRLDERYSLGGSTRRLEIREN